MRAVHEVQAVSQGFIALYILVSGKSPHCRVPQGLCVLGVRHGGIEVCTVISYLQLKVEHCALCTLNLQLL